MDDGIEYEQRRVLTKEEVCTDKYEKISMGSERV
jgi:hypothetical protein